MKIHAQFILFAALALAGCTHSQTAARTPNARRGDVVYTGSNIPQPRNRITASPLSATTPSTSLSRDPDSLVPTEPVVGATDNSGGHGDTGPTPNSH